MEPTDLARLENSVKSLEQRVRTLEGGRPGRKPLPVVVSKTGVCGVDPESDSAVCPHASLYRRQKGCLGTACKVKSDEYYTNYRASNTKPRRKRAKK